MQWGFSIEIGWFYSFVSVRAKKISLVLNFFVWSTRKSGFSDIIDESKIWLVRYQFAPPQLGRPVGDQCDDEDNTPQYGGQT